MESPETTIRISVDGRDDELHLEPTPTCTSLPPARPNLALWSLLRDLEKRTLRGPYALIAPRLVPPVEPVVSGRPTKVRVVLENRGRVAAVVPRDANAVQVFSACVPCKTPSSRVSVGAEPERPIEIPVGTSREVELTAYFREPGPNVAFVALDRGAGSEDVAIVVASP